MSEEQNKTVEQQLEELKKDHATLVDQYKKLVSILNKYGEELNKATAEFDEESLTGDREMGNHK